MRHWLRPAEAYGRHPRREGVVRAPRDWLANLNGHAALVVRLKTSISADLTADAAPITDPDERRRILTHPTTHYYRAMPSRWMLPWLSEPDRRADRHRPGRMDERRAARLDGLSSVNRPAHASVGDRSKMVVPGPRNRSLRPHYFVQRLDRCSRPIPGDSAYCRCTGSAHTSRPLLVTADSCIRNDHERAPIGPFPSAQRVVGGFARSRCRAS
jgi:hypothetical protein